MFELVRGENKRGQVLSELDGESIQEVLADLLHSDIAWLLKDLGPDDVAYILGFLPEERGKDILALMKTEDSTEVADILKYPKDTAGGIMTTEFFSLPEDATAQEAIRRLQQATDAEMVFYIYVTDKDEHLVGVLSLRQLLTVPPATPLKNIMMRDVMSVAVDMDQEEVARQAQYENTLLPKDIDYAAVRGLSNEVQQKLNQHKPETIGQASRISGVTPAAISLLLVHLKRGFATNDKKQSA